MSERIPLISYASETSTLTMRGTMDEQSSEYVLKDLEKLDKLPGYTARESGDTVQVDVEVPEVLPVKKEFKGFGGEHDEAALRVINNLQFFGAFASSYDPRDGVVGVTMWSDWGFNAAVYASFQEWLNEQGVSADVKDEVRIAMTQPFGLQTLKRITKSIKKNTVDESPYDIFVGCETDDHFLVHRIGPAPGERREAFESWNYVKLITDCGNCACLDLCVSVHREATVSNRNKRLYYLSPHNVDRPTQSLSLALGIGVLARHAVEYTAVKPIV